MTCVADETTTAESEAEVEAQLVNLLLDSGALQPDEPLTQAWEQCDKLRTSLRHQIQISLALARVLREARLENIRLRAELAAIDAIEPKTLVLKIKEGWQAEAWPEFNVPKFPRPDGATSKMVEFAVRTVLQTIAEERAK